jgi:hypothetical protein
MDAPQQPQRGEPILPWAGTVTHLVRAGIARAGKNTRIHQHGTGFSVEAIVPRGDKPAKKPFHCYVKAVDAVSVGGFNSVTYRVSDGRIFLSEDWEDLATVTGLSTTDCELSADGDSIWLELAQIGDGTPTITLQHGAVWTEFPAMWKYVAPVSETASPEFYWYQRLAFLRPPRSGEAAIKIGETELILEQVVKTDLMRRTVCVESVTAYRLPQLHPWH